LLDEELIEDNVPLRKKLAGGLTVSGLWLLNNRGYMGVSGTPAAAPVLTSDIGEILTTSEQIVAMAKVIWPAAKTIEVNPYRADRSSWSGSEITEGFRLTISADGGSLVAQIIAGTLDALKTKLDQRSRKKRWGSL
jgi:hypothetical protein